jgi:hypothetical protein
MNDAVKKFFPGHPEDHTESFKKMVLSLQNFDFDTFHETKRDFLENLELMDHVNITELALFVSPLNIIT